MSQISAYVGLVVRHLLDSGFLRFSQIGMVQNRFGLPREWTQCIIDSWLLKHGACVGFCSTWLELGLWVAWYEFKCRHGNLPFSEFAELQWNSSIWYRFRTFQMKTSSALPLVPVLTESQAPNFGLSHAHARVFFFGFEQSYVESVVILPCLLSDEFANFAVPLKKKKREKKCSYCRK